MGNENSSSSGQSSRAVSGGGSGRRTGGGNAVTRAVERASKTGVLTLKELRLNEVPAQILSLSGILKSLDLSFNKIGVLPENIALFTNLRTLALNNNKLGVVPDILQSLDKLHTLHLQHNVLSSLPDSIASLSALKYLDVSHNQLECLPAGLYALPHLDYLKVSHNKLRTLTDEGMDKLNTVELDFSSNLLPRLPVQLSLCKRLKVLRVEENCLDLEGLPWQLLENSNISLLCYDGNLIQQRELQQVRGYDKYMERFTASRRKMD